MKKLIIILALALIFTMTYELRAMSYSHAAIPDLIRYQGTAVDTEGVPLEGPYDLTLRMYITEAGGAPIWQETHQQVTISKGIFTVLLGEITALDLPFDEDYYLSIEINSDGEMDPRQRITSVGYAYRAKTAELATEAETAQSTQEVAGYSVATTHSPASQIYASKSDGYLPEVVDSSSIKDSSITNSKLTDSTINLTTKTTGILPIEKGGTGTDATRYCNLGLNTTGTLPTQYGGTGSDQQDYCDLNLNTTGTLPVDKGGTGNSTADADTVDGLHASTTPEANKIVPLDGSAKLPDSVIPTSVLPYGCPGIFKEFSTNNESNPGDLIATTYFYKHDETTLTVGGYLKGGTAARVSIYIDDTFACYMDQGARTDYTWTTGTEADISGLSVGVHIIKCYLKASSKNYSVSVNGIIIGCHKE